MPDGEVRERCGMRRALAFTSMICLFPSAVVAQAYPIPIEASVGFGTVKDRFPSQWSPALIGALAWDYDKNWWAVPVLEAEAGPTSDAAPCQTSSGESLSSCVDAAVLGGLRFRPAPNVVSGVRPFASVLLGTYWKGSSQADQDYLSSHFTIQAGGGVEIRWAESIQGLRASVDYRRVFAGSHTRNQLRFVCAYVIGPRRFTR